jgi:hypothetical protein
MIIERHRRHLAGNNLRSFDVISPRQNLIRPLPTRIGMNGLTTNGDRCGAGQHVIHEFRLQRPLCSWQNGTPSFCEIIGQFFTFEASGRAE